MEPPEGYLEPPEGYLEPPEGYMEPPEGAPDTSTRNTTATTVITVRIRILIVCRLQKVIMETLSFEGEGQAYLFVTKLLSKSLIKINWSSTCDVDTCQHQTEHEYGGEGEGGRQAFADAAETDQRSSYSPTLLDVRALKNMRAWSKQSPRRCAYYVCDRDVRSLACK